MDLRNSDIQWLSYRGLYKEARSHSPPPGILLVASHHDSRNQSAAKICTWGCSSLDCRLRQEGYDMILRELKRKEEKLWGEEGMVTQPCAPMTACSVKKSENTDMHSLISHSHLIILSLSVWEMAPWKSQYFSELGRVCEWEWGRRTEQGLRRPSSPAQMTGTTCLRPSFLSSWRHTPSVTSVGAWERNHIFYLFTKHIWLLNIFKFF